MTKQFQVVYETKGVKVVNVWLPEGTELPTDWNTMSYAQQDEWLYERQVKSEDLWKDEYQGQAVNVLPVLSLKAVWSYSDTALQSTQCSLSEVLAHYGYPYLGL